MHSFKPVQRRKVYIEIAEQIFDAIITGEFPADSQLPSERVLAESFSVSRSTVREALAVLESTGFIRVDMGRGTFVSGNFGFRDFNKQSLSPIDLLEARRLHETSLVGLILERASNRHLERLEETIHLMERIVDDEERANEFYDWGVEFHRVFVTLPGNQVLTRIGQDLLEEHPILRLLNRAALSNLEAKRRQIQEHRDIVNALLTKDEVVARRAVHHHLGGLEQSMFHQSHLI